MATQKVLVENADVRVSEVTMAPGEAEPEHKHARGVTIALGPYENETTALPERTVTRRKTAFGETRWTEAAHHSTKNIGTTPQRVIRIELKHEPAADGSPLDALDSVVASKETQRVMFENRYVRIVEEKTPAGVAQPKHRHRKSVLVVLADGDLEIVPYDANDVAGQTRKAQLKFGAATWNPPAVHTAKNIGTTEGLNIRVEVK
jgi:predicted metal-dependent enzyme (double-stranded beta helix superfamily)